MSLLRSGVVRFIGFVRKVEGDISVIEIFREFSDGLCRLNEFSHAFILYWLHLRDDEKFRNVLKVHPKGCTDLPEVGVFASRSPNRPNPIGLTVVELVEVKNNVLIVKGLDALPGSPIIDIKPYLKRDCKSRVIQPNWLEKHKKIGM
ncbi:MAG: tRNA (N6-threonylcarbamoyladenosine(37)-N6)-methyltransferase TrmO [Candidatus Baldrarchaeia archaeon]